MVPQTVSKTGGASMALGGSTPSPSAFFSYVPVWSSGKTHELSVISRRRFDPCRRSFYAPAVERDDAAPSRRKRGFNLTAGGTLVIWSSGSEATPPVSGTGTAGSVSAAPSAPPQRGREVAVPASLMSSDRGFKYHPRHGLIPGGRSSEAERSPVEQTAPVRSRSSPLKWPETPRVATPRSGCTAAPRAGPRGRAACALLV